MNRLHFELIGTGQSRDLDLQAGFLQCLPTGGIGEFLSSVHLAPWPFPLTGKMVAKGGSCINPGNTTFCWRIAATDP
jgi:hypothetical protein